MTGKLSYLLLRSCLNFAYSSSLNRFIACGSYTPVFTVTPIMHYSDDLGETWTSIACGFTSASQIRAISRSDSLGLFVAGSNAFSSQPTTFWSTTGLTGSWTSASGTSGQIEKIIWVDELNMFISIGYAPSNIISPINYSTDGKNWTQTNYTTTSGNYVSDIVWSKLSRILVAVSPNLSTFLTSSNGITWSTGAINTNIYSIGLNELLNNSNTVSIGNQAGYYNQRNNAISIGFNSGQYSQGESSVSIGYQAGQTNQQQFGIAIGFQTGQSTQGTGAIAIGYQAGQTNQQRFSVAIGYQAGQTNQGTGAIAIGYQSGYNSQAANSIVINASGSSLDNTTSNSTKINPIRDAPTASTYRMMLYDATTSEVVRSTAGTSAQNKTFIIDHPVDKNKFLVHACLEGPEAGVYYRGKGVITNNISVDIKLPEYVDKIATDLTVHITPIYDNKVVKTYNVSEVKGNKFTVYGVNGSFFWNVIGKRNTIEVEPVKSDVIVKGSGPYMYISEKM